MHQTVDEIDIRPVMTIKQVTIQCGVSRRTVYNWMDRGLVEWVTTPSGSRRILVESLIRDGSVPAYMATKASE